ncbi:hypothetical protein ALC62_14319 [Cyphomyrmex costatus]|uniref:Uncharacterized protein n=1 Tax=Cyphomyrmex costatus TaxID=456900 RepID=A0A151I8Q9_9HYME|nr:hypothetical protein ALC62_14319 [Cyphomyrmex costatus]
MHFRNALSAAAAVEQINKEMKVISTINKEIEQPVQRESSDITNQYSIYGRLMTIWWQRVLTKVWTMTIFSTN